MRHTTTLVLAAAAALVLGSSSAVHADTLGQTGTNVTCSTGVPAAVVLTPQGAGGATYTAAANGVITGFSYAANAVAGQVRAIVFTDGAAPESKTVAAKSPKFTVTASTLNTFPVRLPIVTGQRLGLGYTASGMACATIGVAGDVTRIAAPFDPDTSSTFTATGALSQGSNFAFRPNISAVLEPDVDADQFGDLTQDACPQSALTQAACPPPDTTVTKRPKRFRANPKIKVKFTATIAGSTFECQLDGRKFRPCASPYKQKLKVGLHKLKIRAVSPFGIVDGKPAKVKVEITG